MFNIKHSNIEQKKKMTPKKQNMKEQETREHQMIARCT